MSSDAAPEPAPPPVPARVAPALAEAEAALREGDFGAARRLLLRLRAEAQGDTERAAVGVVLDRLRPDWLAAVLFVGGIVFFVVLVAMTARRY